MKKVILTALLVSAFASTAQAAVIKQNDKEQVSVSGTLSTSASDEVLVAIVGPFDSKMNYTDAIASEDKLYVNAAYANEKGEYSFAYEPKIKNKFYAVSVTSGGTQETSVIYLAENSVISDVLKDINGNAGVEGAFIKAAYKDILITNYKDFANLTDDKQIGRIYNDIEAAKGTGYASFQAFETVYTKATAVQSINNCTTAADAKRIADDYLPLDSVSLYSVYKGFTDEQKTRVFERMLSRDISGINDFYAKINESIFLEKIQNETFSSNLTSFITNNAAQFSINTSGYSSDANTVNAAVHGKYYKTMDDFKTAFNAAIPGQGGTDNGNNGNNNPGGGGGGGGGSADADAKDSVIGSIRPIESTTAASSGFKDLANVSWAKEAILALKEKNIVSGKTDDSFCPDDLVTREEFTKMVVSAFEITASNTQISFMDVSVGSWYYDCVAAAAGNGIIYGVSDSEFGVGMQITRQDIAAILCRIAKLKNRSFDGEGEKFADDWQISDYAKQSVYALRNGGIISGFDDNTFRPLNPATRAEAAVMIYKMLEALK